MFNRVTYLAFFLFFLLVTTPLFCADAMCVQNACIKVLHVQINLGLLFDAFCNNLDYSIENLAVQLTLFTSIL